MSPLLALALVALAIVVGLTWWQRRQHGGSSAGPAGSGRRGDTPVAHPARASAPPAADSSSRLQRVDPVFGPIAYYGGERWLRDGDLEFSGTTIVLEVACGKGGPEDTHRAWLTAFLARAPAIDAEARALLVPEFEKAGGSADGLEPWELLIAPDDDDVLEGRLSYGSSDRHDEIAVRSSDMWRTLHVAAPD